MFILLVASYSCEKALNEIPSDKVGIDRLLNNESSVVSFRENAYTQLPKTFTEASNGSMLEAYSDDGFRAGDGKPYEWHNGLLSLTSTFFGTSVWNSNWDGIRTCNLALENLPKSEVDTSYLSVKELTEYMDEVKVIRSWYHFMLIQNFGPLPFIDQAYGPSFEGWKDMERPSYDAISTRLVEECDEVISNSTMTLRRRQPSEFHYINKAVAYALKSRILLYNASKINNETDDKAKWTKAAQAAQQCLDNITPEYSLLPMADYSKLFNEGVDVYNSEIIYRSVANSASSTNNHNGINLKEYGAQDQSDNCGTVPSQELIDCFELKDGTIPVTAYTNNDPTKPVFAAGYNEDAGSDPYAQRDARFYQAVLFNDAVYGSMQGFDDTITVYTYDGFQNMMFNDQPINQDDSHKRLSCTGYYTRKYRSANYFGTSTGGTSVHKIYFRLAEVYLNLAEARCELGELDAAMTALNMVRERAGQPKIQDVPGFQNNKEFLMKRIRNERRVELCFEGHRYYDQRRWMILDETNGTMTGMKVTSANEEAGPFSYERVKINVERKATTDKYLALPVTSSEIRRLTSLGQPEAWQ